MDREFRVTWRGRGGGLTGRVRQTLGSARDLYRDKVRSEATDVRLQVRDVPGWDDALPESAIEELFR